MADLRIDDYCFPFDAVLTDGVPDRAYKSAQFANYFKFFINDGVYAKVSEGLQVLAETNNMYITVKPGAAFIQGRCYDQTAMGDLSIKLTDGNVQYSRIDRVIVRADYVNRLCKVMVLEGTPAAQPLPVALQRDADAWDILLAEINIPNGATKLTQANITDKRPDNTVCGWVAGAINQIDTTNLFAQYQTAFNEFMASSDTEVNDFIANGTNQLTTQLQTQQTEYNATKNTINNWYNNVKDDISLLQTLDLDNLAPLIGCKKTTTFNGEESVLETLIQTADNVKVAERLTEFLEDGNINITTTRYKNGAAIEKSLTVVSFSQDGSVNETVTNLTV